MTCAGGVDLFLLVLPVDRLGELKGKIEVFVAVVLVEFIPISDSLLLLFFNDVLFEDVWILLFWELEFGVFILL